LVPSTEYWYALNPGYPPDESAKLTNNVVSDPSIGETDDMVGTDPLKYGVPEADTNDRISPPGFLAIK
jgi:hypothetical protein